MKKQEKRYYKIDGVYFHITHNFLVNIILPTSKTVIPLDRKPYGVSKEHIIEY